MLKLQKAKIQEFFRFIEERHSIYDRRSAGQPWPWTTDPILQTYKFTNVLRELDKGTVWYREHIREPYAQHLELFFNTAVYRRHNYIGTAEALGFIEDYSEPKRRDYVEMMMQRRARGEQIFTGAYMTCGTIRRPDGTIPPTKTEQIFDIAFGVLWEKREELAPHPLDTLEEAFNRFKAGKVPGFGDFLIYEVISDLRWTRYLQNATDILSWANPGPGAQRGIMRLAGQPVKSIPKPKRDECIAAMRLLVGIQYDYLRYTLSFPVMEARDIEHSLCEWDKYQRVTYGEGKMRSKFIPPHLRKV